MNNETDATAANITRYSKTAAEWDFNPARIELANAIVTSIQNAVPLSSDMPILDFGAGTGLLTMGLLPHVAHITAIDTSPDMLQVLAGKLKSLAIENVMPHRCNITHDPLPAAEYALVVSSMVLHHIADVPQTLILLRHSLRPGGWIALADLDSEEGSFHADPTGVFHKGFDRGQICKWLEDAGFVDVATRDAYQMKRVSNDGITREYPLFLATGRIE